jgi:lipopolysaccharide transport system permease protein
MTEIIIEAGKSSKEYFRDLWRYRELFYFLAWRDVLVRYKQTIIGVAWSVIRPLLTMVIFTFVFGKIARLPSNGVPYPLLVYSAMLPWQFFANSFQESSHSLITNSKMISKVYFPRLIIPTTALIVSLIDFLISLFILSGLMVWYSYLPGWHIVLLPIFLLLTALFSLGAGLWISALNVKYRDFRYVIPFILQFGLYISPVGFSSNTIPSKWHLLYSLNPMVGVINGFRWSILGWNVHLNWQELIFSFIVVSFVLFTGIRFFRKTEKIFADIL